jgi:hypothetical protein
MARYPREFYEAMDSFLLSEMNRHYEDIEMIIKKRQALHDLGYRCDDEAPWVHTEDIEAQEEMPYAGYRGDEQFEPEYFDEEA